MTSRVLKALAPLAALAVMATPSFADEPGPGGSKPPVAKTGEEVFGEVSELARLDNLEVAVETPAHLHAPFVSQGGRRDHKRATKR